MIIVGVDEAGRGPLAGPVVAAAVILHSDRPITGLADSKILTPLRRERLFQEIRTKAQAWSYARATVNEIDTLNILQATMLAMQRAVLRLRISPDLVLIDGNRCPLLPYKTKAIIGGDATEPVISAASIMAKVVRDHMMGVLDRFYPAYGFSQHKGYGTEKHLAAIAEHGPSRVHRRSFKPNQINQR
jgi:ribonuclease HII